MCWNVAARKYNISLANIIMRREAGDNKDKINQQDKYNLTPGTGGTYRNYYSIINNVVVNIRN